MDCTQQTLSSDFNLVPKRGLLTPRAFVRRVLDNDDARQKFGVENWAADYAEPGYSISNKQGILFGNWNGEDPGRFSRIAEYAGYECEWYDQWTTCSDCNKALRTDPDSYSWSPSYMLMNECEIVCHTCLDPYDVLEELSGDEHRCIPEALRINPTDHGYRQWNDTDYESGWHPGQTDNPAEIAKQLRKQGFHDFVFVQSEQSQFYVKFNVFVRDDDTD